MKTILFICLMVLLTGIPRSSNAQVPLLNSNPSAAATIFIDFDGHTVAGTVWNGIDAIECAGSGLNPAQINEIVDRVSEDYRPFDLNVTTDSTVFLNAPVDKRMRVIVTTTDWYQGVGGISLIGAFIWGDDTPCFVFSGALLFKPKNIAEAVSHEAGHTLGLYHQAVYDSNCALVTSYNTGTGVGEIGWAPIMGVGYSKNFTLWNNGPNPYGCNLMQNDLNVITTLNGFGFRNDDYANTMTDASLNQFVNNQFTVNGVIERNTDKDVFAFTIPVTGRFKLDAIPYNVGSGNAGSDLDMQVTLYSSDQTQLNVYNPGNILNLVVDTILNDGVYYAKVEGKGNIYAPAYASLGSYSLQGSFTDPGIDPLPLRKLELKAIQDGLFHSLSWVIDADEKVVSQTIEYSMNGRDFSSLVQPSTDARNYRYSPVDDHSILYRLNVVFDNGRQYYSNTAALRQSNGSNNRPQVNGNMITDGNLHISSPGNFSYQVMDMRGKLITKGLISNGSSLINTTTTANGMYLISFSNGSERWTEKFIRQ